MDPVRPGVLKGKRALARGPGAGCDAQARRFAARGLCMDGLGHRLSGAEEPRYYNFRTDRCPCNTGSTLGRGTVTLPEQPSPDRRLDDPQRWLGPSALMDLEDPKLRLRVRSLTQLCKSEREKALVLHAYVKRLPLARRVKARQRTAREVYDFGRGDAPEKATLLVTMLRIAGLPARVRYVTLGGDILRGISAGLREAARPIVEIRLDGRWRRTDIFIFDPACMAAARQRLRDRGWEWGYGIHVNGHTMWTGKDDAFLGGVPTESDSTVLRDLGVFHDHAEFLRSRALRKNQSRLRRLYWNMVAPLVDGVYRGLREELAQPPGARRTS
jgi:hypothetical protein